MPETGTEGRILELCHVCNGGHTDQWSLSVSISATLDNDLCNYDRSIPPTCHRTRSHKNIRLANDPFPEFAHFAYWQFRNPGTTTTPPPPPPPPCPSPTRRTARDSLFAAYLRTHDLSFDATAAHREREAAFADAEGHPALAYMLAYYRGPGSFRAEYNNKAEKASWSWRRVWKTARETAKRVGGRRRR